MERHAIVVRLTPAATFVGEVTVLDEEGEQAIDGLAASPARGLPPRCPVLAEPMPSYSRLKYFTVSRIANLLL